MDASDEIVALLREIRDDQRDYLATMQSWKEQADRQHAELKQERDHLIEEEKRRREPYDEATRLYLRSMRWAEHARPYAIGILVAVLVVFAALAIYRAATGKTG